MSFRLFDTRDTGDEKEKLQGDLTTKNAKEHKGLRKQTRILARLNGSNHRNTEKINSVSRYLCS